jgi:leader peptidase (prepilin peptidase) / N-methyltransferase
MELIRTGLIFLLGFFTGMFVNYLSDILPWRRKLDKPFCLKCQTDYPLVNYFIWPRRCPSCGQSRSTRSWVVELFFGLAIVWLWDHHPAKLGFWGALAVSAYFALVTVIDIEYRLILHPVSIFGAGLGLLVGTYLHGFTASILGGAVGFGSMLLLYWLGGLLIRLMGKIKGERIDDVALGFGDVNLSGVLGLMLGFPGIVAGLFLAILIGGLVSLIYLIVMVSLRKYQLFTALPYGPFLIIGAIILLFFSDVLTKLLSANHLFPGWL